MASQLNSTLDKYYRYVTKDARYYAAYLQQNGTECILKKPKVDTNSRINDIELAFGASTYASNAINYDESIIYLLIQPQDFTKIENGIESQLIVVSPEKLDDGYLVEMKRLNKTYTFEVKTPLEEYWGMLYRGALTLLKVQETG